MYNRIRSTLNRQLQGLKVLAKLIDEEYDALRQRKTDEVVALEFSIHELVRQLVGEKELTIKLLDGGRILHYADLLPEEQGNVLRELYAEIDIYEQKSSRNASRNAQMSLALLDQSQRLMQELHSQIIPKAAPTYGRYGAMGSNQRPDAALISGRL